MPFDPAAFLASRPDLQNNWNSNTQLAQTYGDILNYALAEASQNGTPQQKSDIQSGQITTPAGYQIDNSGTSEQVPLEQSLLNNALPGILSNINADQGRRSIVDTLANSALGGAAAANAQLAGTQGGHFDGATYLKSNPDVAQYYAQLPDGPQPGTKVFNGQNMTADQFSEWHYLNNGQKEGRQPAYVQSAQLAQDFNNADQTTAANIAASNTATKTQTDALIAATSQLQGNLQGDLAAKAAALAAQVATLSQSADTLDAAQRAALTQQIATQQQDLETSISTQRQALQDQIAALGTAATAEAQAKRDSLTQEIAGLTAAQAPLNAARTAAADLQATSINVGLERTKDQLTAQNAQAGYVGGSTGQDVALARATIDARQRAAGAMGAAGVANAQDTRDIGFQGATGQRTIADALAEAQNAISGQGATGNAALTGALAVGRQGLGDTQATGVANITGNTALSKAGIGAYGANTTYGNATTGADASRSIADALAQGQFGLTSTNANNTLAAQQAGNAAKATYYDNNFNRSLTAALAPTTIAGNLASTLTGLDAYGNSGLTSGLNTLNWWAGANNPPTPGALATTAGTTGNNISNLGAGLFSAGLNAGQANNWWQTPVKKTTTPGYSSVIGPGGAPGSDSSSGLGLMLNGIS